MKNTIFRFGVLIVTVVTIMIVGSCKTVPESAPTTEISLSVDDEELDYTLPFVHEFMKFSKMIFINSIEELRKLRSSKKTPLFMEVVRNGTKTRVVLNLEATLEYLFGKKLPGSLATLATSRNSPSVLICDQGKHACQLTMSSHKDLILPNEIPEIPDWAAKIFVKDKLKIRYYFNNLYERNEQLIICGTENQVRLGPAELALNLDLNGMEIDVSNYIDLEDYASFNIYSASRVLRQKDFSKVEEKYDTKVDKWLIYESVEYLYGHRNAKYFCASPHNSEKRSSKICRGDQVNRDFLVSILFDGIDRSESPWYGGRANVYQIAQEMKLTKTEQKEFVAAELSRLQIIDVTRFTNQMIKSATFSIGSDIFSSKFVCPDIYSFAATGY